MAENEALLQGAVAMSTISVALLIVFLVALLNPQLADNIRGRVQGAAGQAGSSPTGKILVGALGAFAPDMAILSGFVSDIVNVQFRHSVLSFTAILAVMFNRLIFGKDAGAAVAAVASAAAAAATGQAPGAGAGTVPTILGALGATGTGAAGTGATGTGAAGTGAAGTGAAGTGAAGTGAAGAAGAAAAAAAAAAPTAPLLKIGHTGPVRATITGNPDDISTLSSLGNRMGGKRSKQTGGALPQFFVDNYNPCAIRGLAFLDTNKSPMGMVALMTIFTTVFWDMWINNKRTTGEIVGVGAFGLIVLIMNFAAYGIFDCYGATTQDRLFSTFKAFVWGAVVGSVAFLFMQYAPNGAQYLPTDASSASLSPSVVPPSGGGGDGKHWLGPDGKQACPPGQISVNGRCTPAANAPHGGASCSAPNDDDQFVCDAFKNGKLISSTVSS